MKWAILLGSPDISGGTYVIFEHAIRAKRRGIDVCIITETRVDKKRLDWHAESKELTWLTFDEAREIVFDVAIATWWSTVYELYKVEARTYIYFVQSIESRFYPESEVVMRKLADATYMPWLYVITEATWIQKYLNELYGLHPFLVRNGVRKDIFAKSSECYAERIPGKLRVLVEGPLKVPFKNVERTIVLCNKSEADEVWLLTSTPVEKYPGVDRVISNVPIRETPLVYRSCDVIVKLSYVEGMFGPPLEMFHCNGTAIIYDVSGYDEYIKHNFNAFVVKRDDEEAVIAHINELKANQATLKRLQEGAKETADSWPDWSEASLEFEQTVEKINSFNIIDRKHLELRSIF